MCASKYLFDISSFYLAFTKNRMYIVPDILRANDDTDSSPIIAMGDNLNKKAVYKS